MIKKLYIALLLSLATVCGTAQNAPGSWRALPMTGLTYTKIVDTPARVYYISKSPSTKIVNQTLYSYDKEDNSTVYYTPGTTLSASDITDIYYNPDGKYMLVAYESGNIDLLYDDGRIVNMPEIMNASIYVDSRKINSVSFAEGRIYLATDFGMVIYDDNAHVVVESGIYNKPLKSIMAVGGHLAIQEQNTFKVAPLNVRHNSLDVFTDMPFSDGYAGKVANPVPTGGNKAFVCTGDASVYSIDFDFNAGKINWGSTAIINRNKMGTPDIIRTRDGYMVKGPDCLVFFDKEENKKSVSLPDGLKNNLISSWKGAASVWAADNTGIANYDLSGATPVTLADRYKAPGSMMFDSGYINPSADGRGVIISNIGPSYFHASSNSFETPSILEYYDWETGEFTSLHPIGSPGYNANVKYLNNKFNTGLYYGGPCNFVQDPVDPSLIYYANTMDGLLVVKDNKVIYAYNDINASTSPLTTAYCTAVIEVKFDLQGNLWVGNYEGAKNGRFLKVLPKAAMDKVRKEPTSVKASDWLVAKLPSNRDGHKNMLMCFSTILAPGKFVWFDGEHKGPVIIYDTKNSTSTSDDVCNVYTTFTDQDGLSFMTTRRTAVVEDRKGHIWIGTDEGIFVLTDFDQSDTGALSVRRPKVARNDGTEFADYLLSAETIQWIAVDASDRKWIATKNSGLYLVSADGGEILEHHTMDNSPLISNDVMTVACNPTGNEVLVGTPSGMYIYNSTASPAADDYSDVIAYPNPVRPDYTGWITIEGLMDNSLVKIADAQGNVIAQGRSEGGMYVWDGCNSAGQRVRSGVYMVFASQSSDTASSGAVTKIVVIN